MLPSLDNLQCFEAAARTLNFRAAARAVALSPAAFGQRIKQLEARLGTALFERTTRSIQLTGAGLSLLPRARQCLALAEACLRAEGARPSAVELTLGTRFELGMSWIVPQLDRLARKHPELSLHLYFGASEDLLQRLRDLRVDCVVTSSRLGAAALSAEALHEERYIFVAAPKLLRRHPFTNEADAARHTLLDIDLSLPLFRYFADENGGISRFRFARTRFLGLGAAIKSRVAAGDGVAVLPYYMVERLLRLGQLVRLFPRARLARDYFRLVFRSDDLRRSTYVALSETLRQIPIR